MSENPDCPICKIHAEEKILGFLFKNRSFLVRHAPEDKKIPGYLYVELLSHREKYSEWDSKEFEDLGEALRSATDWIQSRYSPPKIYTVLVAEKVAHMHFHLVPRYEDLKGPEYIRLALEGLAPAPVGIAFPEFA
ncbi:HIT family hydrolase [Leptospira wolffii]|uniref:HIT family hydrolase n=1 Tax=Leptospira wolffii TaxID=409998 RepID=A0A2M9Z9H1_9LEPT|nr:HIT family hydrolase [Leptospira wolffii]PJZ65081.1 HIT family hydrolase [Leptospira wolffii]TGK56792.1 HIT family hydrolase [Leptospira wolffii]TGK71626.1 HIT family hydrolase [Leptospira wolffii]TGK75517.1 HIT family hydrolase [Leptospira wolffii]TGL32993.1 HIT family hydrolase [Leptospira wolffii]